MCIRMRIAVHSRRSFVELRHARSNFTRELWNALGKMTEIRKIWNNPFPLVTAYICRRQIVGDHHTQADKIRQDVWKSNMFGLSGSTPH